MFLKKICQSFVLVSLAAAACGSHEQEDLQSDSPPATEPTPNPLVGPARGNGMQSGNQTPKSTNSLTTDCQDDLKLVTQVANNGTKDNNSPSVRTVLLGEVNPACVEGKTPVLTFSTEHQVTLLPLMNCEIGSGRPAQITCRGKSSEIVNNGIVTIPVLLEAGNSYADLHATIDFQ